MKVDQNIDFKKHKYIQPICLRRSESGIDRNRCYATGWGTVEEKGKSSPVLKEVKLPILDNNSCRSFWGSTYRSQYQVCAGYKEGGRDTCQGDSGGPLSCQLANGVWIQEGITSFGDGCAKPGRPGIYTKVSAYVPWIESVTRIKF